VIAYFFDGKTSGFSSGGNYNVGANSSGLLSAAATF